MRHKINCHHKIVLVNLDDIHIPQRSWDRVMRKDHAQIEQMRADYESDCGMVRVELRPRFGGGYNIQDGRHRVMAAKLAGIGCIEAIIIGDDSENDEFGND